MEPQSPVLFLHFAKNICRNILKTGSLLQLAKQTKTACLPASATECRSQILSYKRVYAQTLTHRNTSGTSVSDTVRTSTGHNTDGTLSSACLYVCKCVVYVCNQKQRARLGTAAVEADSANNSQHSSEEQSKLTPAPFGNTGPGEGVRQWDVVQVRSTEMYRDELQPPLHFLYRNY